MTPADFLLLSVFGTGVIFGSWLTFIFTTRRVQVVVNVSQKKEGHIDDCQA